MTAPAPVEIREARPDETPAVLSTLVDAYGEDRFDKSWLDWKHRRGPWGPSKIVVATIDDEIVATFFVLPWRMIGPDGAVDSARLVDGATRPAAQGRGVLRRMTASARADWDAAHQGIVTATATPTAQRIHLRNGATALDPIAHRYCVLPPGAASLDTGVHLLDSYQPEALLQTEWTGDALRWRFGAPSFDRHQVWGLTHADQPTGAVTRKTTLHRVPVLVVETMWGPPKERRALLRSVLPRERCAVLLAPDGPGAAPSPGRPVRHGGDTLLCVWDTRSEPGAARPLERSGWSVSLADVGGAM